MAGQEAHGLTTLIDETTVVKAQSVESQSLMPVGKEKAAAPESLAIKQVVVGVARFNFQGNQWHNFSFDINVGVTPTRAVVMLALMDIYNANLANSLQYLLGNYSLSYVGTIVRVTGRVFVGDSDGYLHGLSFQCTVV